MKRYFLPLAASFLVLLIFFSYQSSALSDKKLHVVICDVGQGDAIYIRTPGNIDILIDGGRGSRVLECLSAHMPFWDKTLELVFATHPDADHIGGFAAVFRNYDIESFNTVRAARDTKVFSDLKNLISEQKIPYKELSTGSRFALSDGVEIETKWPEKDFKSSDSNDYSLVQHLRFGEFDLLLTGDISYEILNSLDFSKSTIEVFKLPHHGSKTGVDDATFQRIRTYFAIISAGKNNSYHHPHPSVLTLLKKYNVPYKRTDLEGEIEIVTDGKNTKVVK